jgi:exopolyphosphatase/guanosine-5'-triphosphate,3'-diphosphate pyrophosphatase
VAEGTPTAPAAGGVAAVDCGTNSTRLLVLGPDGNRLARRMRITRLGAGVDRTGELDAAAVERTLATLREFRRVLEEHGIEAGPDAVRAAATSATRDARNAAELLEAAGEILGVRPEVIEGREEGRLAYLGATRQLPETGGPYLVVDIGGGSTELIAGAGPPPVGGPAAVVSLDIGCVRLTERYLVSDPPSAAELADARLAARELIESAARAHPELRSARTMVGVAGTVSALAVMALGLEGFVEERVHHARISRSEVADLARRLASVPLAERRELRGMERARADVIVGGATVLDEVMGTLGYGELVASESDILDGIAYELLVRRSAG